VLASHDDLVRALHRVAGLADKGKVAPAWYFRSKAFLHFHGSGDAVHADVRFGQEWEKWPAVTPEQRQALLDAVSAHVTSARRT
jgi:hypothetical protein